MSAADAAHVDVVVKAGGALLAEPERLARVLQVTREAVRSGRRVVVVPGGGAFADAVRAADRAFGLPRSASHWMAVLAMDQYAHLLAAHAGAGARLVANAAEIGVALDAGELAVLAPYAWLRAADPLPHSWSVTSDSIAAWLARALGAPALVLVKAAGARGDGLVDPYFTRALAPETAHVIVPADRLAELASALRGVARAGRR